MSDVYVGYSGSVWQALYRGMLAYQASLSTNASASDLSSASEVMLSGLLNGVAAINAAGLVSAWTTEAQQLASILTNPLVLDPTSAGYVEARLATYQTATVALMPLVPQPASFGASGQAIIPDMNLLGFYQNFFYETPPSGLTQNTFLADAMAVSTSFTNLAQAISVFQGDNPTQAYDVATREATITGIVAQVLADLSSTPIALGSWNQVVALPAVTALGSMVSNVAFTEQGQQQQVIRYTLLAWAQQIAAFILILRQPVTTQINLTTLRNGETLMDVAARTLNDFEQWTAIATLNGLFPPYVGVTSSPGIAGWGTQLVLPSPGTSNAAIGTVPSYEANFLGTDIYFGPLNQTMPTWTGDYTVITGYKNLSWALGRRLQTTLASLIYHNEYGSRIPPEVGAVETQIEAQRIAAFAESALQSDPRVASVQNSRATGTAGLISYSGDVLPNGFGARLASVNEVLSPLLGSK